MLDFPSNPSNGQTFNSGGVTWVFDGIKWTVSSEAGFPAPSNAMPLMDGNAAVGISLLYTRQDHVHPSDTSRAAVSSVPTPATVAPLMDGAALVGSSILYARQDHVHPTDTSRYAANNPSGYQTAAQVSSSLGSYLPLSGGTVTGALTVNSNVNFAGGVISASGGTATITNLTVGSGGLWSSGQTDLFSTNLHGSMSLTSNSNLIPVNNACSCGYGGQAWSQVMSYSFPNASDPRDKKHIVQAPAGALAEVNRVPVVWYRWNSDSDDAPIHTGFLATHVANVLGPHRAAVVVGEDEAKSLALNLMDMIAILWQAVQELSAMKGAT